MGTLFTIYLILLVLGYVLLGLFAYINSEFWSINDRKRVSRIFFLVPVWPLLFPYLAYKLFRVVWGGFKYTWELADWRSVEYDYELEGDRKASRLPRRR